MSLLEVKNLNISYPTRKETIIASKDVEFTLERGEILGIVGESGSGKSTIANAIINLIDPPGEITNGSIKIDNNELRDNEEIIQKIRGKKIGFVFQTFNLLPKLNALQNVEVPLIYSSLNRAKRTQRAKESLKIVGLEDRMTHKPNELSGGQRQRVAIARALVNKPSIILADEPTGNLDSKSGEEILKFFDQLHKAGNTLIVVTHEKSIAKRAKRRVEIFDGKITLDE